MPTPSQDPAHGTSIASIVPSNPQMSTYRYQPLPGPRCIRILIVELAPWDTPIRCRLETVSLDESPDYTSLSYSWAMNEDGDASPCREIQLEGYPLPITRNLFEGLLRLRNRKLATLAGFGMVDLQDYSLRMWVDAVCINQQDVTERTMQVAMMAAIYAGAKRLAIWLGEGHDDEEVASVIASLPNLVGWQVREKGWESIKGPIESFLNRRYFHRRWIVQEVHHSERKDNVIYWGAHGIPLLEFRKLMSSVWAHYANPLEVEGGIVPGKAVVHIWDTEQPVDLPEMLDRILGMECLDDRDRLYSVLSIHSTGIEPDYTKTTAQAYTAFARYLFEQGRFILLFGNLSAWHRARELPPLEGLPSWCPDLRHAFNNVQAPPSRNEEYQVLDVKLEDDNTLLYSPIYLGYIAKIDQSSGKDCKLSLDREGRIFVNRWKLSLSYGTHLYFQLGDFLFTPDGWRDLHVLRSIPGDPGCFRIISCFVDYDSKWYMQPGPKKPFVRPRCRIK